MVADFSSRKKTRQIGCGRDKWHQHEERRKIEERERGRERREAETEEEGGES